MTTKKSKQVIKNIANRHEARIWKQYNLTQKTPHYSAEQILEWLDGMRAFMFEVWKKNPSMRRAYEKLRQL